MCAVNYWFWYDIHTYIYIYRLGMFRTWGFHGMGILYYNDTVICILYIYIYHGDMMGRQRKIAVYLMEMYSHTFVFLAD